MQADGIKFALVSEGQIRVGHVHLMLFVSISFALGSQHEREFWWNMGFIHYYTLLLFFTWGGGGAGRTMRLIIVHKQDLLPLKLVIHARM